jgi:hypothetical protein
LFIKRMFYRLKEFRRATREEHPRIGRAGSAPAAPGRSGS